MHILIIPSWYPSTEQPLAGIFFKEQALALRKAGHKVGVIYPFLQTYRSLSRKNFSTLFKITEKNDFGTHLYKYNAFDWLILKRWSIQLSISAGIKLFRRYQQDNGLPDIIHAHVIFPAGLTATKLKQEYNIPAVITEHSSAFGRGLIKPWKNPLIKRCLLNTDRIIVVSPFLGEAMKHFYDTTYAWIPNLIDTNFFSPEYEKHPIEKNGSNRFIFLSIAQLTRNKGTHNLLQAFARAFKGKQVELRIGGDGEERSNLETQATNLDINAQVKFLGLLNRMQVRDEMKTCDASVLPSLYETFGIVAIEALSCGKPVIATRCGGPEYIINDKNGFLVPKDDEFSLAEAMKRMVKSCHNFSPRLIRNDCVLRFSEQTIVSQLENLYTSVLQEKKP